MSKELDPFAALGTQGKDDSNVQEEGGDIEGYSDFRKAWKHNSNQHVKVSVIYLGPHDYNIHILYDFSQL